MDQEGESLAGSSEFWEAKEVPGKQPKDPSGKFKPHLPPAILIIVLVGTPRSQALLLHCLLPLGREEVFVTSP